MLCNQWTLESFIPQKVSPEISTYNWCLCLTSCFSQWNHCWHFPSTCLRSMVFSHFSGPSPRCSFRQRLSQWNSICIQLRWGMWLGLWHHHHSNNSIPRVASSESLFSKALAFSLVNSHRASLQGISIVCINKNTTYNIYLWSQKCIHTRLASLSVQSNWKQEVSNRSPADFNL